VAIGPNWARCRSKSYNKCCINTHRKNTWDTKPAQPMGNIGQSKTWFLWFESGTVLGTKAERRTAVSCVCAVLVTRRPRRSSSLAVRSRLPILKNSSKKLTDVAQDAPKQFSWLAMKPDCISKQPLVRFGLQLGKHRLCEPIPGEPRQISMAL